MKLIRENLILISLWALVLNASAASFSLPSDFSLAVSPASPRAGENFTITAKSFAFETARAKITWLLN